MAAENDEVSSKCLASQLRGCWKLSVSFRKVTNRACAAGDGEAVRLSGWSPARDAAGCDVQAAASINHAATPIVALLNVKIAPV